MIPQPYFDRLDPLQQEAIQWRVMTLLGAGKYDGLDIDDTILTVESDMEKIARNAPEVDVLLMDYQLWLANTGRKSYAKPLNQSLEVSPALRKVFDLGVADIERDPVAILLPEYRKLPLEGKEALNQAFYAMLLEGGASGMTTEEINQSRLQWIRDALQNPRFYGQLLDEYRDRQAESVLKHVAVSPSPVVDLKFADPTLMERLFPQPKPNGRDEH